MEMLFAQLEKLLAEFLSGFLEKVFHSKDYDKTGEIPEKLRPEYWNYLELFTKLQKRIENHTSASNEDVLKQRHALAVLRNFSENTFKTFTFEN
ncbi:MAG: hypothetical protein GY866_43755 [Proteobacteria bacterium]|nr:hypothetical protein [Pseudomonadota bacterium]